VALSKGKILDETLDLMGELGILPAEDPRESRKLVIPSRGGEVEFLVIRGWDVPTYVECGAADVGVVGLDVLEEQGQDVYRPLDLGLGYCRMVVAEPGNLAGQDNPRDWTRIRVATKYPGITARHFRGKGVQVDIIALSGSIELAPLTGLATRIVDLVSTGKTLRENGLVEVEQIMEATAHLVVNRTSFKTKHLPIRNLVDELAVAVGRRGKAS
jgi:ATP phosphoribosyltransferase